MLNVRDRSVSSKANQFQAARAACGFGFGLCQAIQTKPLALSEYKIGEERSSLKEMSKQR